MLITAFLQVDRPVWVEGSHVDHCFLQVDRPVRVERGHVDNSWIGPQLYHIWGPLQATGGTQERKENPGNRF